MLGSKIYLTDLVRSTLAILAVGVIIVTLLWLGALPSEGMDLGHGAPVIIGVTLMFLGVPGNILPFYVRDTRPHARRLLVETFVFAGIAVAILACLFRSPFTYDWHNPLLYLLAIAALSGAFGTLFAVLGDPAVSVVAGKQ